MNIFLLDHDIKTSASYYADKHVVKIPVEIAQVMCSAHHVCGNKGNFKPPYKLTHKNHPWSIWARESKRNYLFLFEYLFALNYEYVLRYNNGQHLSAEKMWDFPYCPILPKKGLTKFPQCMPEKYRSEDPVEAYRNYYLGEKSHLFSWKNRQTPDWINNVNKT